MSEVIAKQAAMVGRVLNVLAESGIQRRSLELDDVEGNESERTVFLDAAVWLQKEGLISFERQAGLRSFRDCALQSKGFAALESEFSFGGTITTVRAASSEISNMKSAVSAAGEFLGALSGGFYKSVVSQ